MLIYLIKFYWSKGYPTRDVVAFEDTNGALDIVATPELVALISFYTGHLLVNDLTYEELTDKGNIENIEFRLCIVRPSLRGKFDLTLFNTQ